MRIVSKLGFSVSNLKSTNIVLKQQCNPTVLPPPYTLAINVLLVKNVKRIVSKLGFSMSNLQSTNIILQQQCNPTIICVFPTANLTRLDFTKV